MLEDVDAIALARIPCAARGLKRSGDYSSSRRLGDRAPRPMTTRGGVCLTLTQEDGERFGDSETGPTKKRGEVRFDLPLEGR